MQIIAWLGFRKLKTGFTWSLTILSTSTDCPPCSLLSVCTSSPLSCPLLMHRLSVQRRKACLSRWRVSKKGRQPIRCPSLPLLQFSRQNNRSLSPCSVCSPSCRAPPTRVPCKAQITGSVVIHDYLEQVMTVVCGDVDESHVNFCLVLFCFDFFQNKNEVEIFENEVLKLKSVDTLILKTKKCLYHANNKLMTVSCE